MSVGITADTTAFAVQSIRTQGESGSSAPRPYGFRRGRPLSGRLQNVEGGVPNDGEAPKGPVPSRLAAVPVEDDVHGPVQVILDAPSGPYGKEDRVGSGSIEATKNQPLEAFLALSLVDTLFGDRFERVQALGMTFGESAGETFLIRPRLVGVERQQVVAAHLDDPGGDRLRQGLTSACICFCIC